jgi:thiol-disulfide isomerase/thioredoxin
MRGCAPGFRGFRVGQRRGLAGRVGLLVFVCLQVPCCLLAVLTLAMFPADALQAGDTPHQLVEYSDSPKPPIALLGLDGGPHDLQDYAGRLVLVHFFATWCEACVEELASLARLAELREGQPFSILAVDVGEVPSRVKRLVAATPANMTVLLDSDRAVTKGWNVDALPTTFVLDNRLMPRLAVTGDLDWTSSAVLAALDRIAAPALDGGLTKK